MGVSYDTYVIFFSFSLYKSIIYVVGAHVEAIEMSTNKIYFYKAVDKCTQTVV